MLSKLSRSKMLLTNPGVLMGLRILILVATLIAAFFVKTGVVSADPGWGLVGG